MTSYPSHWQGLATAYLLGHATPEQVADFETLYSSDAEFRAFVTDIEAFLAPLNSDAVEAAPPAGLLDDIMEVIEAEKSDLQDQGRRASNDNLRPAPQRPWQYATAASVLVAAAAIGLHFLPGGGGAVAPEPTPQEELYALMSGGEEAPSVVVLLYDKDTNTISGRLTNTSPPAEGVWQLWLLREGIDAPQSLGLLRELSEDGRIDLSLATELDAGSDTLAISVEPEGGSPETGPTGPIVFTGKVGPI